MPIKVYTYKNRKNELFIEFLGQTTKDKLLTVPLDKTFDTIIKRIQNEEPGLFEQFSSNLVEESLHIGIKHQNVQIQKSTSIN